MTLRDRILADVLIIRNNAEQFLTDTCSLYRKTGETIDNGESRPVYANPVELECRLIVRSGADRSNIAAQERVVSQLTFTGFYRLQLPYGTEVSEDDRITMQDTGTDEIKTYSVIYVPLQSNTTGAFIIAIKEEM